ncbi:hypothetical protein [Streptomyces poonensis]|uniref:Regulatory protein n=1 Tax=Streptomyces poonensis TaxID=68255 RepID=A0A918PCM7_9ACTN|nr:hypothetical protein [Streptomyces poonensis]GGY98806.1 hypothetical protein GCM10010365_16830 [Streptomyces poonensis]
MPETAATTDLTSQYAAQLAGDLERNASEQERISTEITVLQEQLTALQRDHAVLVNMQQALGLTSAPAAPAAAPSGTTVPAPREDAADTSAAQKRAEKKSTAAGGRGAAKKPAARKTAVKATTAKSAKTATEKAGKATTEKAVKAGSEKAGKTSTGKTVKPTLVELVRRHLTEQSEPRSAAEIATALGQAHPERGIKTTVVRTTIEGLVARNQAQRTKQGSSVYYTAPETAQQASAESEDRSGTAERTDQDLPGSGD